jgi:hypothetical protein
MSEIEVFEDTSQIDLTVEEATLDVHKTIQEIEVTLTESGLEVEEVSQDLEIQQAGKSVVELFPNAMLIQQFFSGEGAVADQDTIVGLGTAASPLNAPDMLRISQRLGEFDTQTAKNEARDNLGLNIIDGGTFT